MNKLQVPKVEVELRTSKARKDGKAPLFFRITYNGKKVYLSLGKFINPANWNNRLKRVKAGAGNAGTLNEFIRRKFGQVNSIIDRMDDAGKGFNLQKVRQAFLDTSTEKDFFTFAGQVAMDNKADVKPKTYEIWISTIRKLEAFTGSPVLDPQTITDEFLISFYRWCRDEQGLANNTLWRIQKELKPFIKALHKKGLIAEYPHQGLTYVTYREQDVKYYLTEKELFQLQHVYHTANADLSFNEKLSLQAFLLSCYTGLRFSDVIRLKWSHIIDGELRMVMQKTQLPVSLPWEDMELAQRIATNEDVNNGLLLAPIEHSQNDMINDCLKRLLKKYGIASNKKITFKTGRDTFAILSLLKGIPLKVISSMLGHTSVKTTEVYAKVVMKLKKKEILKWKQSSEHQLSLTDQELDYLHRQLQSLPLGIQETGKSVMLKIAHLVTGSNIHRIPGTEDARGKEAS